MTTHRLSWNKPVDPADFAELLDQEWLLTNGSGAYAMGSVAGVNTRRYHGLLIACTQPPVGRVMLLNQMLEYLSFPNSKVPKDQAPIETATCAFLDDHQKLVFAPHGLDHLKGFEKDLHVKWTSSGDAFEMTRTLRLHWQEQAATLEYVITPKSDAVFTLVPMWTLRDFHAMRHAGDNQNSSASVQGQTLQLSTTQAKACLHAPKAVISLNEPAQSWWYNLYYTQDHDRGQEDHEDAYTPATLKYQLKGGKKHTLRLTIALGTKPASPVTDDQARQKHLAPMIDALSAKGPLDPHRKNLVRVLAIAADDFVVRRTIQDGKDAKTSTTLSTILAGYPWFSDWGRDTFISLPGLLLETGRLDEARDVLHAFASQISDGLVPNRFDDYHASDVHYNTVDASLWFIDAAMKYHKASDDQDAWNGWLAKACTDIIDAYLKGTRYDIQMTGDGLISAGNPDTQLTWMDAACDGKVFTPRQGKAVEINALWFHVLTGMSKLLVKDQKSTAEHYKKLAGRIGRSFMKVFWNPEQDCLRDHVWTDEQGNKQQDNSLRPNQIFACSLEHTPVPKIKRKAILKTVRGQLLTPYGLRTLPQTDPNYHGQYSGPPCQRDEAYHQGTIWPWLMGPFIEAELRAEDFSTKAKHQARETLEPLLTFLEGRGTGQLYEIHEADQPHRPVGCPAQAWSVAQVLAVLALIQ